MQRGTTHTEEARERIAKTKRLQYAVVKAAEELAADRTSTAKQLALAEAIDALEGHKGLQGAIEKALRVGSQGAAVHAAAGALQKRLQLRADIVKAEKADEDLVKAKAAELRMGKQDLSGFGITERVRKRAGRP